MDILNPKYIIQNLLVIYYKLSLRKRIKNIKSKKKISVLFVVSDLSKWKTKSLYYAMLNHDRFLPNVGVTMRIGETASSNSLKTKLLIDYLENNKIKYTELMGNGNDERYDIIIYQEPYIGSVPIHNSIFTNLSSLFISIHYGFHTTILPTWYNQIFHKFCWFDCFENQILYNQIKKIYPNRKNIVITGLPFTDELLTRNQNNPWNNNDNKIKIIWAPHHTIGFKDETITNGSFLNIAQDMINLAIKYKNMVQWAFKPHPWLKAKLELYWGKKKADEYYNFWETFESSQAIYGEYIALFQHSDAMIHDCSSFIVEYLYMGKPVLFINNNIAESSLNEYAKRAYELHYKAKNANEIEAFINYLISRNDPLRQEREKYKNDILIPPNNTKACDNIINYILN